MLSNRTVTSSFLVIGGRLTSRLIDLAALLILTRLLLPSDFGSVALAISLVSLIDASLEFPLNQALLSVSDATQKHYETALTLSVCRGMVLFVAANSLAYPYARFFGQPQLQLLIFGLSAASLLRTFTSPALAQYQRQLIFWRDVGVEFTGKIMYLVLTVIAAVYLENYWAFVVGTLASSATNVVVSYALAPFRPKISFHETLFFKNYIGSIAFAQVISTLNWQSEKMLLGKFYNDSQLGVYTTANDIAQMPLIAVLNPILRPLLATFARERQDEDKLAEIYLIASSAILTVALPILIGICLVAENIVSSLFDAKWHSAIYLLELLSLSMLPGPFAIAVVPLVLAYGRSNVFLYRSLIECSFKIPFMIVGLIYFGLYGVIFARLISEFASIIYSLRVAKGLIGVPIRRQLLCGWQSVCSSAAMVPVIGMTEQICIRSGWRVDSISLLILLVLVGVITYLSSLLIIWSVFGHKNSPVTDFIICEFAKLRRRVS